MRSVAPDSRFDNAGVLPVTGGSWRVDSARSIASFTARVAGRSVRGRLPLSGAAHVSPAVEDSAAYLCATTGAVSTGSGMLDGLIAGAGFLDSETYPDITFRSDMLVCAPTGWRAVGHLRVKGAEHPLVCELDAGLRARRPGVAEMTITTRWVIDSAWITTQWVPMLARRIAMSCSVALEPVDELDAAQLISAA
jgi:polyisoprenoid-binding protein YceI